MCNFVTFKPKFMKYIDLALEANGREGQPKFRVAMFSTGRRVSKKRSQRSRLVQNFQIFS